MKAIAVAMQAHLELPTTNLAICILVTRLDAVELAVTSFNKSLTFGGNTYEALGFMRTDVDTNGDMDVGTTELTGILRSDSITEDDVRAGLWDFAAFRLVRVCWSDLTIDPEILAVGNLGVCRTGRLRFVAELLSLMQAVQNSIGALNSALCIHELGDNNAVAGRGNGCTVNLAAHTVTGTIDSMDSDYYGLHDAARVEADAYFSNGKITFTSGLLDGLSFEVRSYIVGFWVLFTAVPYDATGCDYEMVRGCNKSRRQCVDDFNNIDDRLASDYTQGGDAAVAVARHNG